jgi:hypothetical protein
MSNTKTNNMKVEQVQIHPNVVFLKAPEGVDMDAVDGVIGEDNWDLIFLADGIVCAAYRAKAVERAYQEALDELEEE